MKNTEIKTKRTLLRKYSESDREIFADIFTDEEVSFHLGGPKTETRKDAYELFDKCFDVYRGYYTDRHFEIWGIEFENRLIGHFELKQTENTIQDELEIVYLLDKKYWGKGLMPEIIIEMKKYARSINKNLIATINPDNIKTANALKKTGIETEGWIKDSKGKVYKVRLNNKTESC